MSQIASFRAKLSMLTEYLDDPHATEIQINKPGELWVRKKDAAEQITLPALTYGSCLPWPT